jgi:ribosomal protein S18 acetylase RimI-like enzyme
MVDLVDAVDDAEVGAVYRTVFADELGSANPRFVDEQLPTHRGRAGFRLVGAVEEDRLVGFAYGYTGERGQDWTEHVVAHAPEGLVETWVGGHFELVDLAVLPEVRGRGIGEALMTAVVRDRRERCALLGTGQRPSAARRLYERLGWTELLHDLDGEVSLYGRTLGPRR